jgi:hypothetical protein
MDGDMVVNEAISIFGDAFGMWLRKCTWNKMCRVDSCIISGENIYISNFTWILQEVIALRHYSHKSIMTDIRAPGARPMFASLSFSKLTYVAMGNSLLSYPVTLFRKLLAFSAFHLPLHL